MGAGGLEGGGSGLMSGIPVEVYLYFLISSVWGSE